MKNFLLLFSALLISCGSGEAVNEPASGQFANLAGNYFQEAPG